jgi:Aminotransferase class I and II
MIRARKSVLIVGAPDALIHPARQQRLPIARGQTVPGVSDRLEQLVRFKRRPQEAMRRMLPGSEQIVTDLVREGASERAPQNEIGQRVRQALAADNHRFGETPDIPDPDMCEGPSARVERQAQRRQLGDLLRRRRTLFLQEDNETAVRSGEVPARRIVPYNPDVQRRPDLLSLTNHLVNRLDADPADGRPILPLASADASGTVIYVGSLSKTLAPGLRLGYIAAPPDVIAHMTHYRALLDTQGDRVLESAVAELLEDGEVQRHVRRVGRIYRVRRDATAALLTSELGDAVSAVKPVGGTAFWVRVAADVDLDRWRRVAADQDVLFETGDRFAFDGRPLPYIRIGYAGYREAEMAEAVRLLAAALSAVRVKSRTLAHKTIATVA